MSCDAAAAFVMRRIREFEENDSEERERKGKRKGKDKREKEKEKGKKKEIEKEKDKEAAKRNKKRCDVWCARVRGIVCEMVKYLVDDMGAKDNVSIVLLFFLEDV